MCWPLRDGLPRLDEASDERRLHLGHGIVDGDARTVVQDLDAEDFHRRRGAQLVRAGERDVERQDLIGVPGLRLLLEAADVVEADAGELIDVAAADRPFSRTSVLWKIAFCDRKAFSSVRNCGRMSSTLAMKLPFILYTSAAGVPDQDGDALVDTLYSSRLLLSSLCIDDTLAPRTTFGPITRRSL